MTRKLGIWLVLLTAASVTVGAAAVLDFGPSAPLQVMELDVTAPVPTSETTTTTTEEAPPDAAPPDHGHGAEKIWVCVIVQDHHGNAWLKGGQNPLHVSVHAQDALDARSPHRLSYEVPSGDVKCAVPEH